MNTIVKQRIARALKCELSEVPEDAQKLKQALDKRRSDLKKSKEAKKHG